MKESFSPSEIRNLLGISRSAIQYYRDKKLIDIRKNEENGYSYYSGSNLLEIIDISFYRNCMDATVEDIAGLLSSETPETYADVYSEKIDAYEERIRRRLENLSMLRDFEKRIRRALNALNVFKVVQNHEKTYLYQPDIEHHVDIHTELFWTSYWNGEFYLKDGEPVYDDTYLFVDEKGLTYLKQSCPDATVWLVPPGRFIYSAFCSDRPLSDTAYLKKAIAYADENHIPLSEPFYVSYLFTFKKDGVDHHCYECTLPIQNRPVRLRRS